MAPSNAEQAPRVGDGEIVFGYWNIRGLGQAIRYVLEYAELQFDERRYSFGEQMNSREEWLKEKFTLGLDFPNLPYLKAGDVKLTQSLAILRFLARRHGLFPETEQNQQRVDLAEQQINDIIWECVRLCYNKEYNEKSKEDYVKQFMDIRCSQLEAFLGDRNYIAGDQLTFVDFLAWEMFDQHRVLWPEYEKMYSKYPRIESYLQRIEAVPKFAKYLQSDRFISWPVWSERSFHGGPTMATPKPPIK